MPTPADPVAWGVHPDAVEVIERRTRHAKHFRLPSGSYQAVFGNHLHYDDAGAWEDVNLEFRADGSDDVVDRHEIVTRISGTRPGLLITERASGKGIRWITPARPTVSGRKARFADQGLDWEYATRKSGVKLTASVSAARGPYTYQFQYALVGGAADLTVDADGNLVSDAFRVVRPFALGADERVYPCSAWRLGSGNKVEFDFDDSALPAAAFPYVLDPTATFNVAASADDAVVYKEGATYPPDTGPTYLEGASDGVLGGRLYNSGNSTYYIYNGLARWDTSSIPDNATIDAATFRAYVTVVQNADSRNITADWYTGAFDGTAYSETAQTDANAGVAISSFTARQDNDITLTGYATGINKTGYTALRFHCDGGQPTGMNRINIAYWDNNTHTEPRLIVDYTEGAAAVRRKHHRMFGLLG